MREQSDSSWVGVLPVDDTALAVTDTRGSGCPVVYPEAFAEAKTKLIVSARSGVLAQATASKRLLLRRCLPAFGLLVALGACDASAPLPADSADVVRDAATGSPESPAWDAVVVDAGRSVDGRSLADASPLANVAPTPDAAGLADAAPDADAVPVEDVPQLADAAQVADARASWPLGMNDVTILTPLPASMRSPVLLRGTDVGVDGASFVPRDLYDELAGRACVQLPPAYYNGCQGNVTVFASTDYERLHLVAVRFDLCDRNLPGTCAEGEDGRLRLVWQPLHGEPVVSFADAGLHAFYSIPRAELPPALATLRELARLQREPVTSALAVSPGLSAPSKPEYTVGVRAFVRAYAQRARLVRLALNAQPIATAQIRWLLRGLERRADGMFHDMVIPGSSAVQQDVFARGRGFEASPAVDLPAGFTGISSTSVFEAASREQQTTMLEALLAADHPMKVAPDTAPCVACHTSSTLLDSRAAAVEILRPSGGYVTSHNVSVGAAPMGSLGRKVRALGYLGVTPVISRRVAHETAQVLTEIEQRFP